MLKGFHYPLTPKGMSTLNPPPPWHYSADFLYIEFWADPTSVNAILPAGLDPDPRFGDAGLERVFNTIEQRSGEERVHAAMRRIPGLQAKYLASRSVNQ